MLVQVSPFADPILTSFAVRPLCPRNLFLVASGGRRILQNGVASCTHLGREVREGSLTGFMS